MPRATYPLFAILALSPSWLAAAPPRRAGCLLVRDARAGARAGDRGAPRAGVAPWSARAVGPLHLRRRRRDRGPARRGRAGAARPRVRPAGHHAALRAGRGVRLRRHAGGGAALRGGGHAARARRRRRRAGRAAVRLPVLRDRLPDGVRELRRERDLRHRRRGDGLARPRAPRRGPAAHRAAPGRPRPEPRRQRRLEHGRRSLQRDLDRGAAVRPGRPQHVPGQPVRGRARRDGLRRRGVGRDRRGRRRHRTRRRRRRLHAGRLPDRGRPAGHLARPVAARERRDRPGGGRAQVLPRPRRRLRPAGRVHEPPPGGVGHVRVRADRAQPGRGPGRARVRLRRLVRQRRPAVERHHDGRRSRSTRPTRPRVPGRRQQPGRAGARGRPPLARLRDVPRRRRARATSCSGATSAHWSFFADTDGSHVEGNDIEDLGGGRFRTSRAGRALRPARPVPDGPARRGRGAAVLRGARPRGHDTPIPGAIRRSA